MTIKGNKIIADDGKTLMRKADRLLCGSELELGYTWYIGNKQVSPPRQELPEDYCDVYDIEVEEGIHFYAERADYAYLKTGIVNLKYTNDDQIALMLNYQQDPDAYHEDYAAMQRWRAKAREVASRHAAACGVEPRE